MRTSGVWLFLSCLSLLSAGCGSDAESSSGGDGGTGGDGGAAGRGGNGGAGGAGGIVPAPPTNCDPLSPTYCAFPYPNDYYTVEDATTATGRRLALPEVVMPPTATGLRSNPEAFNEMDGFSPGISAMTHLPGATVTGCATPDTIGDSLLESSPTVIINTVTDERVPHWVDRDEWAVQAKRRIDAGEDNPSFIIPRSLEELQQEQAMMLRPAIRLDDATRYVVAFRDIVDDEGALVDTPPGFAALRDGISSDDDIIESRRAHFEGIFEILQNAGVDRESLQVAWDFTTASKENNTSAMVHIRDDAFAKYADGVPYTIAVKDETRVGMACKLEITFDMPLYTTGGETGALLNIGEDGLPEQNGTYPYLADVFVPETAQVEPAGLVEVGHGQLGRRGVGGLEDFWIEMNLVAFGLDHKGFSSDDIPTVVDAILGGDLSEFRAIPERMHQGHLNFLMAMRTMSREADGGESTLLNQVLSENCGGAMIDGSERYYFGGSQGGILGAVIMALNLDIEHGLLAVPGQSYNLLLNRSVNFDDYAGQLYGVYDWNALHMQMNLALIQGLWDRAEPTGYSRYIRDPDELLPGTMPHEVVIQVSKADHQVTNLGAHIMARTIGGVVNLAPTFRSVWGLEEKSGVHTGSAMLEIDFGNDTPPITNIPHWADTLGDPHGRAGQVPALGPAIRDFFTTGQIQNPCMGPCDEDDIVVQ